MVLKLIITLKTNKDTKLQEFIPNFFLVILRINSALKLKSTTVRYSESEKLFFANLAFFTHFLSMTIFFYK